MDYRNRQALPHHRPSWACAADPIFITLCHKFRGTHHFDNPRCWGIVLEATARLQDQGCWTPLVALAMPDHLHAIMRIRQGLDIGHLLWRFKRDISFSISTEWQKDGFDHRLRCYSEYLEKRHYVLMNPVRAGLCAKPADWPFHKGWDDKLTG